MTSAYPIALDELTDKVRDQATDLGRWPSRNEVMRAHRVGGPKANEALTAVRDAGFDPRVPQPNAAHLHAVTTDHGIATNTDDTAEVKVTDDDPDAPAALAADPGPTPAALDVPTPTDPPAPVIEPTAVEFPASPPAAPAAASSVPSLRWLRVWLFVLAAGAFTSIWGGWVGLGELTGFGPIRLLPGIADGWVINSAITLPLGMEAYAALALRVWLSGSDVPDRARRFARNSAVAALAFGAAGQIAYHLMSAAGVTSAPWLITAAVACIPVGVLGAGAALIHLTTHRTHDQESANR